MARLELYPGVIGHDKLGALARALGRARPTAVGSPPRLVGTDGQGIELPEEIIDLLVVVIEQLISGSGVSVVTVRGGFDRATRESLDALTAEAQDLGLYGD